MTTEENLFTEKATTEQKTTAEPKPMTEQKIISEPKPMTKFRAPVIDKKTGKLRKVGSFAIIRAVFGVLGNPKSTHQMFRCFRAAISCFFIPQYAVLFKLKKIPVVHVDNELDYKVPFTPLRIKIYLDFLHLWISPMSFILRRVGLKKASPYCAQMLDRVTLCYRSSYRMYAYKMTTTNRPKCKVPKEVAANFRMIRFWDPHYMCVPSLHIALVVLAYTYFRKVFAELDLTEEEQLCYNTELYKNALSIAETVLYVKQHSVNCIPAALYMMRCIIPDLFSEDDVKKFIADLFSESDDIKPEGIAKIRNHISNLYGRFMEEGKKYATNGEKVKKAPDWEGPVKDWLDSYVAYEPTAQEQANMESGKTL